MVDSRSLASDCSPQLPHPLASEHQTPPWSYRLSTFHGRAPRIVEPLDNRSASDLNDIEATAPRLPEGAVHGSATEEAARDFSSLNLSDLVDQSGPKAPASHVQLPAPPRSTPDENEPRSRVGKQRQNEQEEKTEQSPTETDPGFATAQVQVLMSGKIFGE